MGPKLSELIIHALWAWFMQNGNNLSKILPPDIKNKRMGVSLYVCFSRMLVNLVQTLNEMKLFKVNHRSHFLFSVCSRFMRESVNIISSWPGLCLQSHELCYPSAVHQSIRQQLVWPPGFAAVIDVVINSQLFYIMFSSQADIVCLIIPAVWVEELKGDQMMQ